MARSFRKHPYGHRKRSSKKDKTMANRRLRHLVRMAVNAGNEPPLLREVSSTWDFKDGLYYFGDLISHQTTWTHFTFEERCEWYAKMMRK